MLFRRKKNKELTPVRADGDSSKEPALATEEQDLATGLQQEEVQEDPKAIVKASSSVALEKYQEEAGLKPETTKSVAETISEGLKDEEKGQRAGPSGASVLEGREQELAEKPTEEIAEGYSSEEEILKALAEQTGMPFVEIDDFQVPEDILNLVDVNLCRTYKVFPLKWEDDGALLVAMSDPLNVRILDDLNIFLQKSVRGAIAPVEDIVEAIDEYYGIQGESVDDVLEKLQEEEMNLEEEDEDFGDLERIANEAPIIKLVSLLLLQAIKDRASDLHLEPFENSFRIRYRVDGTLHETMPPPRHLQTAIVSRLKVMAQMNIAERRLPQDGRIPLSMADREIDLRVSSLPTVNGESIVMRILDKTMMKMGLEQIGLLEDTLDVFEDLIKNPNGIILVTGPTGCGKTTTLYAALDRIYNPTLKIITTENPVEYQLDGVVQVNINASVGLTFASCLRSILRQDPDVIMVGEIRDLETAQIAIESALTGHLVLSTLHTNDAPSAVTRLVDMDVEPFLVTSSVIGVVAQRLVRTICSNCKEKYQPKEELFLEMEKSPEDVKGLSFYRGRGCVECNYSGYRGRIGIFELFRMSEKIYDLVLKKEPSSAIRRQARAEGMRTLREDGWEKITMGLTTLEEVVRGTL